MRSTPKRAIRLPVMKLGAIHRQDVPLDAERGVGNGMAAADHGQRR